MSKGRKPATPHIKSTVRISARRQPPTSMKRGSLFKMGSITSWFTLGNEIKLRKNYYRVQKIAAILFCSHQCLQASRIYYDSCFVNTIAFARTSAHRNKSLKMTICYSCKCRSLTTSDTFSLYLTEMNAFPYSFSLGLPSLQ